MLHVPSAIVEPQWVLRNLENPSLILMDATIPKVGAALQEISQEYIPNSISFDIKNEFSEFASSFPNTVPSIQNFELKARKIGVFKNSCIVVYDQYGIYSSPRAWWLFHLFGFTNIAVLNGGIPRWKQINGPLCNNLLKPKTIGDFKAYYQPQLFADKEDILNQLTEDSSLVFDARKSARFFAQEKEPRPGLRKGHIPNSKNIPFETVLNNGITFKTPQELRVIFKAAVTKETVYFSCGSGITACILALAYHITGKSNYAIYDGSWTEWGSDTSLPIQSL